MYIPLPCDEANQVRSKQISSIRRETLIYKTEAYRLTMKKKILQLQHPKYGIICSSIDKLVENIPNLFYFRFKVLTIGRT